MNMNQAVSSFLASRELPPPLREKLIKIGAKIVSYGRSIACQVAATDPPQRSIEP
jgi:hypothetical protein